MSSFRRRGAVEFDTLARQHISDNDLERYHLGMVTDEAELARPEEHLLICPVCVTRAEKTVRYVNAMRAAMVMRGDELG